MVDAVDHDLASGTVTTAWGGVKGAIKGALFIPVVSAIVLGAVGAGIAALAGGALGVIAAVGIGSAIAGVFATTAAVPLLATAGGIIGLFSGSSRVSQENQAYQEKLELRQRAGLSKLEYAAQAGAQQGYVAGRQQGQQEGVAAAEQLYAQRMTALAEKMGSCPVKSHAAAIEAERKAAAATQQGRA